MELSHKPCPFVGCGSSDAFSYNVEKMAGYCHSCGGGYPSSKETYAWAKREYPAGGNYDFSSPEEEIRVDVTHQKKELGPEYKYLAHRGISSKTMEFFNVLTNTIDEGGRQVYPYPNGTSKVRVLPKDFSKNYGFKDDCFFGMDKFAGTGPKNQLVICEGEGDCMSAWQMVSENGKYPNSVVVSLPNANPSPRFWKKMKDYLDKFDKILVSADVDPHGVGEGPLKKLAVMYPSKVYRIDHFGFKDANEILQSGKEGIKKFRDQWFNPQRYVLDNVLYEVDHILDMYENTPDFEYCPTGIEELDDKILGLNKGYFTLITAPTGIGKTEFMRYLEYQVLQNSDYKFAYMHLEESELRSVLGLVSYDLQENVTLKTYIKDKGLDEAVKDSMRMMYSQERMFQFSLSTEEDHNDLINHIRYLVGAFGVDFVFFEPIQDVVDGNQKDKESKLADLSSKIGRLCSEINVGIVAIAHENSEGDTMYSSMIGKKAAFEIKLSRDPDGDDPNTTHIRVGRKNRTGRGSGPAGRLEFDENSYTLKPFKYLGDF